MEGIGMSTLVARLQKAADDIYNERNAAPTWAACGALLSEAAEAIEQQAKQLTTARNEALEEAASEAASAIMDLMDSAPPNKDWDAIAAEQAHPFGVPRESPARSDGFVPAACRIKYVGGMTKGLHLAKRWECDGCGYKGQHDAHPGCRATESQREDSL
jgi:hypothetical protein